MAEPFVRKRKTRKTNFSADEVKTLLDVVSRNSKDILSKTQPGVVSVRKRRAWDEVLRAVNAIGVEHRTLTEIKNKWKKCRWTYLKSREEDLEDEDLDSMPLLDRLSAQEQQPSTTTADNQQPLRTQPLSPTKLRVVRQKDTPTAQQQKQAEPPEHPEPSHHQQQPSDEVCLRWNSHHSNMQTSFPNLLQREQHVDVTLAADGKLLKCHKLILSSCSTYFDEILSTITPAQHPVIFLKDTPFWILKSLCDYMYAGEVHIDQGKLEELLRVAEVLKIKGLARRPTQSSSSSSEQAPPTSPPLAPVKQPELPKSSGRSPMTRHKYQLLGMEPLDPLKLLQPQFREEPKAEAQSTVQQTKESTTKPSVGGARKMMGGRRMRKRKNSDDYVPPAYYYRKGTRTRPQVKLPRHYQEYDETPLAPGMNESEEPLFPVESIKQEPIDVVENDLNPEEGEEQRLVEEEEEQETAALLGFAGKEPAVVEEEGQREDAVSQLKITDCRTESEAEAVSKLSHEASTSSGASCEASTSNDASGEASTSNEAQILVEAPRHVLATDNEAPKLQEVSTTLHEAPNLQLASVSHNEAPIALPETSSSRPEVSTTHEALALERASTSHEVPVTSHEAFVTSSEVEAHREASFEARASTSNVPMDSEVEVEEMEVNEGGCGELMEVNGDDGGGYVEDMEIRVEPSE